MSRTFIWPVAALFLAAVFVGGFSGCVSPEASHLANPGDDPTLGESDAIESFRKLGCKLEIDEGAPGKPVVAVDLFHSRAADEDLIHLNSFPRLESLYTGESITDRGMTHIGKLRSLRSLHLGAPTITDDGLKHVRELKELRSLSLGGTKITDAGLTHLTGLGKLRHLSVVHTGITDDGLAKLKVLPQIEDLWLGGCKITDAGLAHLSAFATIRSLYLSGPKITDAGMKHLGKLTHMRDLNLNRTAITDQGMAHLEALTAVESLDLSGMSAAFSNRATFAVSGEPPRTRSGNIFSPQLPRP